MTDLELVATTAADASRLWAVSPPHRRAQALVAVAGALDAAQNELVALGVEETGLSETRLTGELKRTTVQLKMFADIVVDGGYLDVRIDEADPEFVLGARPDLRRYLRPLGPVLNFAASNFPFAFSIAGGDTAAALAAGCAVIVKGHPGHPRVSARTTQIVAAAVEKSGAPAGLVQLVMGQEEGVGLLRHPRVAAGSFTGSTRVGRMLAEIAAARPAPIPFFGELGSVNPTFVTRTALDERGAEVADGFLASVCASAGQLCTKPGLLFVPHHDGFAELIASRVDDAEHRLLNPSIASGYDARRSTILGTPGVEPIVEGSLRFDDEGQAWATPTIVRVSSADMVMRRETLVDEAFGPLSVIVEYDDEELLVDLADELFEGSLTGTIHAGSGETSTAIRDLVDWIARHAGRVLFGGWPTGVAVTSAQQHGGPWPATTNDTGTSVGGAALSRFLRPVAYQSVPQHLLPEPLRDDNPWQVPQRRSSAGESKSWGSAYCRRP
jgi:NADP-dependent aldehyde dehydrogenase